MQIIINPVNKMFNRPTLVIRKRGDLKAEDKMRSLMKMNGNGNRGLMFPEFPSLFDDFLTRDFFNQWPVKSDVEAGTLPAVNVKETEASFEMEVAAPGMEKKDFKIELENNTLTISAQRENKTEEKSEDGKYARREFSYQSFKRSFNLPEELVDSENISASYKDGILSINVPKKELSKQKAVKEIQIG